MNNSSEFSWHESMSTSTKSLEISWIKNKKNTKSEMKNWSVWICKKTQTKRIKWRKMKTLTHSKHTYGICIACVRVWVLCTCAFRFAWFIHAVLSCHAMPCYVAHTHTHTQTLLYTQTTEWTHNGMLRRNISVGKSKRKSDEREREKKITNKQINKRKWV